MSNTALLVLTLLVVAAAVLYLARVLRVRSSEPRVSSYGTSLALSAQPRPTVARPAAAVSNRTPIAMPGSAGRLITNGSVSNPPEPGGYIADSEITEVTSPSAFRLWYNVDDKYPTSTFSMDTYGDIIYPWKNGFYVRSGFW